MSFKTTLLSNLKFVCKSPVRQQHFAIKSQKCAEKGRVKFSNLTFWYQIIFTIDNSLEMGGENEINNLITKFLAVAKLHATYPSLFINLMAKKMVDGR